MPSERDQQMAAFLLRRQALQAREALRPMIEAQGVAALKRLLPIAESDTGQSRRIARFLLGLYNGTRFPFDLTELRCIDFDLFEDCLAVLHMDHQPERELHRYFEGGGERFEALARHWDWTE